MAVKIGDARDRLDNVGRLVHHDHRRRAEPRLQFAQSVEIHRRIDDLFGGHQRHRRAAGNDCLEVLPAAANATAVAIDQFLERDRHGLFKSSRLVHMAGNTKQLGALVVVAPERGKPVRAAAKNGRRHRNRFDIVDRGRAAVETDIGREWRLETRLALFAFQTFQ